MGNVLIVIMVVYAIGGVITAIGVAMGFFDSQDEDAVTILGAGVIGTVVGLMWPFYVFFFSLGLLAKSLNKTSRKRR